jgi:hypothetical protein
MRSTRGAGNRVGVSTGVNVRLGVTPMGRPSRRARSAASSASMAGASVSGLSRISMLSRVVLTYRKRVSMVCVSLWKEEEYPQKIEKRLCLREVGERQRNGLQCGVVLQSRQDRFRCIRYKTTR